MRIDEIDSKHKEFKKVILNHDLTEEQLDEIVPVIGAVAGGVARAGLAAGQLAARGVGALARGVGAVARGVGQAASAVGRGVGQATSAVGRGAGRAGRNVGQQVKTQTKDQAKQKIKDFFTQANQDGSSSNQQTGTQGTIGTQGTQGTGQQAQLQRGQELDLPQTDPKNPNRTVPTKMKVKNVTGREVELQPSKKQPGQPNVIKYDKKDLQI
jgi:hypothetical protein